MVSTARLTTTRCALSPQASVSRGANSAAIARSATFLLRRRRTENRGDIAPFLKNISYLINGNEEEKAISSGALRALG